MAMSSFIEYLRGPQRPPGETKLLRKIDFFILTFCCLMYFVNYLDRSNLANAYVSGMQQDLKFHGNQYTVITSMFTVGYTIGSIPSNIALSYISPRIFLPGMTLIWGALTMCTAAARTPQDIMAIRFFLGLAESSTFSGVHYILGSWYTKYELGKRSGIFTASGLAGTMIGGFIQSGIYTGLNGKNGLAGWRWLFIIDGLITFPVFLYGVFLFPDTPATTHAFYLTVEERALAVARVPEKGRNRPQISMQFVKYLFKRWYWCGFTLLWIIAGEVESFSSNSLLSLYMNAFPKKYTVQQKENYPTGVPAVGIISTLFWATLTDFLGGHRYLVGYAIGITGICTSAMILSPHASTATVFGAYYWAGTVYACQATFFAWANDSLRYEDDLLRAVVIASMNTGSNAVNAWWSIIFYSADMAPKFKRGMWAMIGVSIAMILWTAVVSYLDKREARKCLSEQSETETIRNEEMTVIDEKT
ncbi:Major facilitator superfamily domain, general substrate transporter [Ascosphaera apis ARSEF 7405]|uniref:Major facilitator superfamily domain, general substrate transporter n=1 Tax=Ascosphaera apis ARSEF 7405 TaxID=392613 RepID=A0A168DKQ6_9EURO|nr:Major facilitator superfamily domain, general substrate transporter [Ascosphaera apis ARSEF 7405]